MPTNPSSPAALGRMLFAVVVLAGIFLAAVTWNRAQIFVPRADGGVLVVLADGDCHSRMQRAAMVAEHPGTIIRKHDFENHPQGTVPHTTAPMDYLIAALGGFVHPLDVAGAWISPLLGLATALFLFFWAREIDLRPRLFANEPKAERNTRGIGISADDDDKTIGWKPMPLPPVHADRSGSRAISDLGPRWPMLLLFAVSPALTHAFALGRPDHQSLLVALTTIALASNFAFNRTAQPAWAWTSGAAWGLSLWVSWFEPLVLLVAQEVARLLVLRGQAYPQPWRKALLLTAGIALAAWALEGFRHPWPPDEVRALFPRWAAMLGELAPTNPQSMFSWTGWLLVPAPALLIWDYLRQRDPLALVVLVLLVVVTALTGWQARWNAYQAAIFCLALPWVLAPLQKAWLLWTVFLVGLWPVAWAWDARVSPSPAARAKANEAIVEAALIEQTAQYLRAQPRGGVLAPWWISPALARLSGQPFVGGTSHQSLPGTADTARFFLATDDAEALRILRDRQVLCVVTDDPDRVVPTSAQLLGVAAPEVPLINRLARGRDIPEFLEPVFANQFFRVYKVRDE